jgi:hypothetical protein
MNGGRGLGAAGTAVLSLLEKYVVLSANSSAFFFLYVVYDLFVSNGSRGKETGAKEEKE